MVVQTLVCYGLYYSKNWEWINLWFAPVRKKGRSRAVWLLGLVLAIMEIIRYLPYIGNGKISSEVILSIFHSYLLIQVFVDTIVNKVHDWVNLLKKVNGNSSRENQ
jgi:hypothetical protein